MTRLAGKKALVTGGRRGIGRAIVERFASEGAELMTCGRGKRPKDLPEAIGWHRADVSIAEDVVALTGATLKHLGGLDIVVNNAGIQIEKTLVDTTDEDWDALMGVNARGVFLVCRAVVPIISVGGSIINLGSVSGNVADPGLALYNASKAFVHGLTRSIAVDHGPQLRCNAICPGWILTDMTSAVFDLCEDPEAARQDALDRHASRRFGTPEDIASLATWLASAESDFTTGQCFVMDGGLTAASPINSRRER